MSTSCKFGFCLLASTLSFARALWAVPLAEGMPFPELSHYALEGRMPAVEGRVVLVDFWASWCGPCKKSFPSLDKMHRRYADRGFEIIAVSVDDTTGAMARFLKSNPVRFPVLRDTKKELVADVRVPSMPSSYLVDRKGVVRFVHHGFHGKQTEDELRREIESLLGENDDEANQRP